MTSRGVTAMSFNESADKATSMNGASSAVRKETAPSKDSSIRALRANVTLVESRPPLSSVAAASARSARTETARRNKRPNSSTNASGSSARSIWASSDQYGRIVCEPFDHSSTWPGNNLRASEKKLLAGSAHSQSNIIAIESSSTSRETPAGFKTADVVEPAMNPPAHEWYANGRIPNLSRAPSIR